ncbi:AAA family ATPase [Peribacillus frigoritolerans]|uniref:McrB family protein n=1 Tax=Peribacillus frigoritolerans TaxID=450367 RepID=UPI003ED0A9A3
MNKVRSWEKVDNLKNLIGRKQVDWSIFEYGSHIPSEFHEDFADANGEYLKIGNKKNVELIIDDKSYLANLVNNKRDESKDALQLRYDSNKELKELMKHQFKSSFKYISEHKIEKSKKPVITPSEAAEFIDFYKTDRPYVYQVKIINKKQKTKFWWVNQGKAYNEQKMGGYLWAPQKSKQNRAISYHIDLLKAEEGDLVFCYSLQEVRSIGIVQKKAEEGDQPSEMVSHGWKRDGIILEMKYFDLESPFTKEDIPLEWRIKEENGPFDRNGDLKQGYFYSVSEELLNRLFERFSGKFPEEIRNKLISYSLTDPTISTKEEDRPYMNISSKDLITHIHSYITAKGFLYTKEEVTNLFLSLKTKPFVILSGISGTGKTKIVQWFAESVGATEENGQFTLIPIRPDWNDGSDLLGYVDIKGDFKPGPFTTVIEKAEQNPDDPYFVLLDEMNLARVEHYFSDVLSVMESRKWEDGKMVTSALLSEEMAKRDIKLPVNLYVIGTVNMDETTHPFSKKVLDRANTIEFNRVELSNLAFLKEQVEVEPKLVQDHMFRSKYLHLKDLYLGNQELVEKVTAELEDINKSLQLTNSHIGYRVRDEVCFYLAYNEDSELMSFENAFDHCILQKILPRISGSDTRVERLLEGLYRLFTAKEYIDDEESNEISMRTARYPKSAGKVVEMLRRLRDDGFTSFWIS